jgi:hypothetical protein
LAHGIYSRRHLQLIRAGRAVPSGRQRRTNQHRARAPPPAGRPPQGRRSRSRSRCSARRLGTRGLGLEASRGRKTTARVRPLRRGGLRRRARAGRPAGRADWRAEAPAPAAAGAAEAPPGPERSGRSAQLNSESPEFHMAMSSKFQPQLHPPPVLLPSHAGPHAIRQRFLSNIWVCQSGQTFDHI